jgi:hypothetical protein
VSLHPFITSSTIGTDITPANNGKKIVYSVSRKSGTIGKTKRMDCIHRKFAAYLPILWIHKSSSARRYSSGWALASLTISLHWSLFLALSVQPLISILLRSSVTSSVHLNLGLPILLLWLHKYRPGIQSAVARGMISEVILLMLQETMILIRQWCSDTIYEALWNFYA